MWSAGFPARGALPGVEPGRLPVGWTAASSMFSKRSVLFGAPDHMLSVSSRFGRMNRVLASNAPAEHVTLLPLTTGAPPVVMPSPQVQSPVQPAALGVSVPYWFRYGMHGLLAD